MVLSLCNTPQIAVFKRLNLNCQRHAYFFVSNAATTACDRRVPQKVIAGSHPLILRSHQSMFCLAAT